MKRFMFSWCVCSFDQECIIEAKTEEEAREIFKIKVSDPPDRKETHKWAAHYATVANLSEIYTSKFLETHYLPTQFK